MMREFLPGDGRQLTSQYRVGDSWRDETQHRCVGRLVAVGVGVKPTRRARQVLKKTGLAPREWYEGIFVRCSACLYSSVIDADIDDYDT